MWWCFSAIDDYPQYTIAELRDACKAMLQIRVHRIGFGYLRRGQRLFHPGDLDLPLLRCIPGMIR